MLQGQSQKLEKQIQKQKIQDLATSLAGRLVAEGFIVQRYDAYSTNSVYLKLDYGVCNSIRISDHTGKAYLKYRYNLGTHIPAIQHDTKGKFPRHYYPAEKLEQMIQKILKDRKEKQVQYGENRYQMFMEQNQKEHQTDAGFWKRAYRVY